MPQLSPLQEQLNKIGCSSFREETIASLEAIRRSVSDVSYHLGEKDSLELRKAIIAILGDCIDRIQKSRKI